MTTTSWIIAIVLLLAGLVTGYFAGRATTTAPVDESAKREALAYQIATELAPLNQALSQLDVRVGKMDATQKSQLAWLIEQAQQAYRIDQDVLTATQNLDSALRQAPKRGTWGEVSLRRVLEMSGLAKHIDFGEQVRVDAGAARPDVVVYLPGQAALVIDAKVPLDAYLRSIDDEDGAHRAMVEHVRAVRGHINQLSGRKYKDVVDGSLDAVILYMPSEALVSATFEADPDVFDHALAKGIIVAGPSTLHTLLSAVGHVWSQQSLEADAQAVLTLGRTLVDRLNVLNAHLTKLGESLRQSVANYNRVVGSFEQRLVVSARQINSFERVVSEPPATLEQAVREPNDMEVG